MDAQSDARFISWLKMQEAAVPLVFTTDDVPELRVELYSPESIGFVEKSLLDTFNDESEFWRTDSSTARTMRFVYYIGECFRVAYEGSWVALPRDDGAGVVPVVDLPFRETFIDPIDLSGIAVVRRTGTEIAWVFARAGSSFEEWTDQGRPPTIPLGTLSEEPI
ncbi:hypothetical protein [Gordonia sp. NPDC003950]